jgi:hypothetical protein
MRISVGVFGLLVWGLLGWGAVARGQPAPHGGFALLIGSNAGGPGQADLRYAEADTERMADVLTGLGGYSKEHVERLLHPSAAQLRAAIDRMRAQVAQLAAEGQQSRFFFYYSGHARADALNLGREQLPLGELRERIEALPATLSIVVLDACQSGAFSRPKGAQQAADFSFNSVERLNAQGIAVVASSNERELSQESELLRSSYFTHHWLVGLRGAGDLNSDGRVTLSEAYQYAYNHTLATTAQSAVGEQHATLETNLRGQDDVSLTQPALASARLRVPAPLEGRLLLQALPSWSVLAELDKVSGQHVTLALPPGQYSATLRRGDQASRCALLLRDGAELQLEAAQCEAIDVHTAEAQAKGAQSLTLDQLRAQQLARRMEEARLDETAREERWIVDIGFGAGLGEQHSRYLDRIEAFGFTQNTLYVPFRASASAGYRLHPHLVVGLNYYNLDSHDAQRTRDTKQELSWTGHALAAYGQADVSHGRRRMISLFARIGAGASLSWTRFDAAPSDSLFPDQAASLETTSQGTVRVLQHFVRPSGFVGAGFQIMPTRYFGMMGELRYVLARAIENELGESHDMGGWNIIISARGRTWD